MMKVLHFRYNTTWTTVRNPLFGISTARATVVNKDYPLCTVGCDLGRQFVTRFLKSRLPGRYKTTVQKQKVFFRTVVSENDFSKPAVEKEKVFRATADSITFS